MANWRRRTYQERGSPTIFAMVDGLTPELAEQMDSVSSCSVAPITPVLGYSPACHASMLTGVTPARHGHWFLWTFQEDTSHLATKALSFVPRAAGLPTRLALKALLAEVGYKLPMPVHVSRNTLGMLRYSNPNIWREPRIGGYETLLGLVLRKGGTVCSVGVGDTAPGAESRLVNSTYVGPETLTFICSFGEVDSALHKFGPASPQSKSATAAVDKAISTKLLEIKRSHHAEPDVVIASDHGHAEVRKRVDIIGVLRSAGLPVRKLPFIVDTTVVRFKLGDNILRSRIQETLEGLSIGEVLSPAYASEYGVPFGGQHGDLIFTLTEPLVFSKTIWGFSLMKSMHGYPPDRVSHPGILASSTQLPPGPANLLTVHEAVRRLIETSLPRGSADGSP